MRVARQSGTGPLSESGTTQRFLWKYQFLSLAILQRFVHLSLQVFVEYRYAKPPQSQRPAHWFLQFVTEVELDPLGMSPPRQSW